MLGESQGLHGESQGLHVESQGLHVENQGLHGENQGLHGENQGLYGESQGLHVKEVYYLLLYSFLSLLTCFSAHLETLRLRVRLPSIRKKSVSMHGQRIWL